ncbi:MAG: outer membrane beta-barrel protein, partial [bacterium]|nr:outer membrane beta-barrel protein [bacterium]
GDRGIARGQVQLGYSFSPGYSVFVRGMGNNRDFFNRDDRVLGDPYQSSAGYTVAAGVSSVITNLVAGELWVGYLDQMYFSNSFKDVSGVSFGANIDWFATAMTTVTLYGGREVVDSTTGEAGGIFFSTAGIGVEHFFLDDLILSADIGYYNGDYIGDPRDDDGLRVDAGIRYLLNQYVTLEALYRFDNRYSNLPGQDFDRHQVDFGFVFQI